MKYNLEFDVQFSLVLSMLFMYLYVERSRECEVRLIYDRPNRLLQYLILGWI